MNERIRELADQAGADFMRRINYNNLEGKEYEEDAGVIFESNEQFEKFAELIVGECAQVIQAQNDDENDLDSWDRGFVAGLATAIDAIEQHFGVES